MSTNLELANQSLEVKLPAHLSFNVERKNMITNERTCDSLACIACVIAAALVGGCSDALENKTRFGIFRYKELTDSRSFVRIRKADGATVWIHCKDGVVKDFRFFHPKEHPLSGRVRPAADGKTLHEATELLPTLIAIAKGDDQKIDQRVLSLLEDGPADLYDYHFIKEPGKYRLRINENLYLKGYDSRPHASMPYVAYWGPQFSDGLGDDVIYCGDWVLDNFCQNMPLKVGPENLHRVKAGDVIDFEGCKIIVEYIDWDNDQDPRNNSIIIRIEGLKDLSQLEKGITGDQPIKPYDFVRVVSWPKKPAFQKMGQITGPVSVEEFKRQIRAFASSKTERERGSVVKDILLNSGYAEEEVIRVDVKEILSNAGYAEEEVIRADSGYEGSEDIWIIKKGQSEEVAIIAAHYDKAGEESQGIIDNACGVVVAASIARALRTVTTHLTYVFLFYGAEEVGRGDWAVWLVGERPLLRSPIKYAVNIEGGGLVGSEQTFHLTQQRCRGWLYWRFPELLINETGGPQDYLKHTAKDNIGVCDFTRLVESQNRLLEIIMAIERHLQKEASQGQYQNSN